MIKAVQITRAMPLWLVSTEHDPTSGCPSPSGSGAFGGKTPQDPAILNSTPTLLKNIKE